MPALIEELRIDLSWINRVDRRCTPVGWGWGKILRYAAANRSFRAVLLFRLLRRAYLRRRRITTAVLKRIIYHLYHAEFAPSADIAPGLRLPHPTGVIIGGHVSIGPMTTIGQHVTLGGNFGKQDADGRMYPRIGRGCWIAAGAVVAGPIDVGDYAIIGANSLVTRDVPERAIVGGIPAREIRRRSNDELYWDMDVDT